MLGFGDTCDEEEPSVYQDCSNQSFTKQYKKLGNLRSGRYGDVIKVELTTNQIKSKISIKPVIIENNENNPYIDPSLLANTKENKEFIKEHNVNDSNHKNKQTFAMKCQEAFNGEITKNLQTEIDLLKILKTNTHPNVIEMDSYFIDRDVLLIVFPFYDSDLDQLIKESPLSQSMIQNVMKSVLNGLAHIHSLNIIHRDIKPNNILICTQTNQIVITDFGSARDLTHYLEQIKTNENESKENNENEQPNNNNCNQSIENDIKTETENESVSYNDINQNGMENPNELTPQIYIVSYRSPELLLGERNYTVSVDMWAVGCIMAQMCTVNGHGLFDKNNDIPQLFQIFQVLGGPEANELDGVGLFNVFFEFETEKNKNMREVIDEKHLDDNGCDLLRKLLTLNPKNRITANHSLNHPFLDIKSLTNKHIISLK